MDDRPQSLKGFAILCDIYGEVLDVVQGETVIEGLVPGKNLNQLIIPANQMKLFDFLSSLQTTGFVFDWEFILCPKSKEQVVRLSGVLIKSKIMLIGLMIPPDFLDLYKELMVINNYQTNALRIALKEQNLTEISIRSEDALAYEDMSRMNNELISLQREIAKKNLELERLYAEVKEFSITDPLTGLLNRRGFSHRADQEWNHAVRYKRSITAIMFDIDNFKLFNDTYGHAIGDVVLKKVAERSSMQIRNVDILSRYGGEEFCLILPEIPVAKAALVAEKLRKSISKEMETEAGTFYVTISLGLAANKNGEKNLGELLENADKAMYHAKQTGRDRICIYPFSR